MLVGYCIVLFVHFFFLTQVENMAYSSTSSGTLSLRFSKYVKSLVSSANRETKFFISVEMRADAKSDPRLILGGLH